MIIFDCNVPYDLRHEIYLKLKSDDPFRELYVRHMCDYNGFTLNRAIDDDYIISVKTYSDIIAYCCKCHRIYSDHEAQCLIYECLSAWCDNGLIDKLLKNKILNLKFISV